jgi:hypothetical protein
MATTYSNDVLRVYGKQEAINGTAKTLTVADSGKTFLLSGTGVNITLPSTLKAGITYKFIVAGAFATDFVIDGGADKIFGSILEAGAATETADAADSITFEDGTETVGDFAEITCDGTNWYVFAVGKNAASITAAG